ASDRELAFFYRCCLACGRGWVCLQAVGDVLEIAIGTGRNLPFCAPDVRLTGVEFSPAMLEIARQRATELARQVDLRVGDAQALDLAGESIDIVVCTRTIYAFINMREAHAL